MTDTIQRSGIEPDLDDKPREPLLGLSPLQLMGGALAAITTAVVSSYLGVAGTLIGAALASILSTVGAAFYTQSITAARGRIVSGLSTLGDRGGSGDSGQRSGSTAVHEETLTVDTRSGLLSRAQVAIGRVSKRAWIGTAAVFLMAIVAITGFEVATGKPVSATVTGGTSGGTTIGSVVEPGGQRTTGTTEEGSTEQQTDQNGTPVDEATPAPDEATPAPGRSEQEGELPVPDTTQAPGGQNLLPEPTQQPQTGQTADPGQGDADGGQEQPAPQQSAPQQEAPGQDRGGDAAPVPDNG